MIVVNLDAAQSHVNVINDKPNHVATDCIYWKELANVETIDSRVGVAAADRLMALSI